MRWGLASSSLLWPINKACGQKIIQKKGFEKEKISGFGIRLLNGP
jgi:hypothetical protein